MKKQLKKGVKIFFLIFLIFFSLPFVAYRYYETMLKSASPESEEIVSVEIPMGTSLRKAASLLKESKLIKNEKVFLIFAKLNDLEQIKSGNYSFRRSDDVEGLLLKLNSGAKPIGQKVTIPEGFERINIAEKLASMNLIDQEKFLALTEDKSGFTEKYPFLAEEDIRSLEGYLYPDTYYIAKGMDEHAIIEVFLDRFRQVYEENSLGQELEKKNLSLNEFITMASVVEREAVLDEERPTIAGVFYNRLNVNMPLQSCATVQYILKERKPVLSAADIKIESPYNTYLHQGLPPTPIASPGIKSIQATLYPEKTDYIYFVARGDGGHEFSLTYEEHLKARSKYIGN
ncbi:MAG: endolytic transglycosylase MltG [Peptostreptococcaceae bacterium]|nr:endolytic transglycosylase MltG [Peptostreptococcaceae bacterium]